MSQRPYSVPGENFVQEVYPIDEQDAAQARRPWFLPFEPAAGIAVAATGQVEQIVSWRDFVCTRIGFTSETVGFPAVAGRWRVQIQDIGASQNFQPQAFNMTSLIGGNFGASDNPPVELPVPWVFMQKTTIRVLFENINNLIAIPSLLLIGYLTNWKREATAAQANNELTIKAMQAQAGVAIQNRQW